jgi:hypothetical protein
MNEINIKSSFKSIIVIIKVEPYYQYANRKKPVRKLDMPGKLWMKLEYVIDYYNLYEPDEYINGLITKNCDAISGEVMQRADAQVLIRPDGVDYTIEAIVSSNHADKSLTEGIDRWMPVNY